ncbi:hypothetical protein D3C84_291320 [compost metagenome]
MVGANGAGTDETHRASGQQRAVDAGHRTHQQKVGIGQRSGIDSAAGQAADLAQAAEEGIDQGYVFVGNYSHDRLRQRDRHSTQSARSARTMLPVRPLS